MKGPFVRTLVIVLVAAGLGAYVFLVENKKPADTGEKKKEKVFALTKAKVKAAFARAQGRRGRHAEEGRRQVAPRRAARGPGRFERGGHGPLCSREPRERTRS
jgi:hypothetical protein